MTKPDAPQAHTDFVARYPKLNKVWEAIHEAGLEGPLDQKTTRLIKLAIAIGVMRKGAVHASVRKADAVGDTKQEIEQVVALAAGTLGLPSTVAIYAWVRDSAGDHPPKA